MGKSRKKQARQKRGDSSEEDGWDPDASSAANNYDAKSKTTKDMNFAERRELQRKEAAAKHRANQRCFLCGKRGHLQRECTRLLEEEGGGVGEANMGTASHPKRHRPQNKKGPKNRGRKPKTEEADTYVEYPDGFIHLDSTQEQNESSSALDPFWYYDASCDTMATLEYIRSGRGKQKTSMKDSISEYQEKIDQAATESNYGGRISRSLIRPNRPWILESASPLLGDNAVWFVIGLARDFLYNDNEKEAALSALLETQREHGDSIVGFFCDLDYSPSELARSGCDKECQLRRLGCTCKAAAEASIPIQIRVSPSGAISRGDSEDNPEQETSYLLVMEHLEAILTEVLAKHPSLKVHLSCWSGEADHMTKLLQKFSNNIWLGLDASVTFAKVVRAHECAFEIPLCKLLLETGSPNTIPTIIARSKGRDAFNHSGLIPFIAQAIAEEKSKAATSSPEIIARAASANTLHLYHPLSLATTCS